MMNKQQLSNDMQKFTGGSFITRKQITKYLCLKDPKSVDCYTHGLPSVNSRFFIPDVAESIINAMKWR